MGQLYLAERSILIVHRHTLRGIKRRVCTIDDFPEYCIFRVEMGLFRDLLESGPDLAIATIPLGLN
jgi:hypothetical protein